MTARFMVDITPARAVYLPQDEAAAKGWKLGDVIVLDSRVYMVGTWGISRLGLYPVIVRDPDRVRGSQMKKMIKSMVEMGLDTDVMHVDLPDGWDGWTRGKQDEYLVGIAVDHQNNVAPCGAEVVDVPDDMTEG